MKQNIPVILRGYNIVIHRINKNGAILNSSITLFSKNWKEEAKEEFNKFEPGKLKTIKVYKNGEEIYSHDNRIRS